MEDFMDMVYFLESQKQEDFIDALAREEDPNDPIVQNAIAYNLGIDTNLWTKWDIEYIEQEVARRWSLVN